MVLADKSRWRVPESVKDMGAFVMLQMMGGGSVAMPFLVDADRAVLDRLGARAGGGPDGGR